MGVIWPNSKGMRIVKLPVDIKLSVIDYPLSKAKKTLRTCGRNFGITKAAKRALQA